ncbi:DegT/DnrJ/EryC1/StrS family aminotransferase [Cryobacterium ruanii]|uniref:DegT/DnrJ/EryC1/StrS family aminotransferase n=1 Tax=Cryobacterium ruanii TaxID=1259197 RepID=UPI001F54070C|nr:DegT/DnrJ/EryC1/StrS family aminotransferase [Cryobacterium ruanii]
MTYTDQIPLPVPLVDLSFQHALIKDEVQAGFDRVMANGSFILGPEVERFEAAFAAYCGVDHVLGVANGTDALELVLRAAQIGLGDEVILPANTFVATAEAVLRAGAIVKLVDCDEDFLIDPEAVRSNMSARTRAVIGVHLYGQMAPMELLRRAGGPDVFLVEDLAQAHGATRFGARAGSLGDAGGTSFYPGKNLGAYGDGGAVLTNTQRVSDMVRALRNHGGTNRYEHRFPGLNSRLDGLQGVVLSAKLARLDGWNQLRRDAARYYDDLLQAMPEVVVPRVVEGNEHVYHLYVVRVPNRDRIVNHLTGLGISASVHYPVPVHLQPGFSDLGLPLGTFPVAERLSNEIMSLPIFPGITNEQQDRIVAALQNALVLHRQPAVLRAAG